MWIGIVRKRHFAMYKLFEIFEVLKVLHGQMRQLLKLGKSV